MRPLSLTSVFLLAFVFAASAQDLKSIQGSWVAEFQTHSSIDDYKEASLTMKWESNGERFRYTFRVPISELDKMPDDIEDVVNASFQLDREAGSLTFDGSLFDDTGSGKFSFNANPDFLEEMHSLGYSNISAEEQLKMAIHDVTTDFVRRVRELGSDTES